MNTASRSIYVLADQIASSASNFLLMIFVARSVSTEVFGTFTVVFAVTTFGLGVGRAVLGTPINTDLARLNEAAEYEFVARSLALALGLGALVSAAGLLLLLSGAVHTGVLPALIAVAVAAPLIIAQDLGRYANFGRGKPLRSLISDSVWLSAVAAAWLWSLLVGPVSISGVIAVWLSGGVGAFLLLGRSLAWPQFRGTMRWFRTDRRRWHLLLDASIGAAAPLVVVALTINLISPSAVGAIRGATTLLTPMNVLISAAVIGLVGEASRRTWADGRSLAVKATAGMVAVGALWACVLLLLPAGAGERLLGETWPVARRLLPLAIIETIGTAVWSGAIALLIVQGRTAITVRVRGVCAATVLVSVSIVATSVGTAVSVQTAVGLITLVGAFTSWWFAARRPQPSSAGE